MSLQPAESEVSNAEFEEHVQTEGDLKARTLTRIRSAAKTRSYTDVSDSDLLLLQNNHQPNSPERLKKDTNTTDSTSLTVEDTNLMLQQLDEKDIRNDLFKNIPEPYPHSTNFQRVIITDTTEKPDRDTVEVAKKLKMCMDIRTKYISKHPFPPQDREVLEFPNSPMVSNRKRSEKTETQYYRRRDIPHYDIFDSEIPPTATNLQYKMCNGVVEIYKSNAPVKDSTASKSNSAPTESMAKLELQVPLNAPDAAELSSSLNSTIGTGDENRNLFPVISFDEFEQDFTKVTKHSCWR